MINSAALKEWNMTIEALIAGSMPLLIRKGGIKEQHGQFTCPYPRALLFPTFEHQNPACFKPEIIQNLSSFRPSEGTDVTLKAWAEFTTVCPISPHLDLPQLSPFHIWTDKFVDSRLRWKPNKPLWIILCRVYRLSTPFRLEWHSRYGGCRSWIDFDVSLSLEESQPVLPQEQYDHIAKAVQNLVCDPAH